MKIGVKEKADAQALKNAELRSGLIPASKVDETWQRIVTAVRLQFQDLPDRLAPMLEKVSKTSDRRAIIEVEIKNLWKYSQMVVKCEK